MSIHEISVDLNRYRVQQSVPSLRLPEGTYWDPILGQFVNISYDAAGEAILYYPASGFYAQGFMAREEKEAATVWPSIAPLHVIYGDTVRVNYSFKYRGPKRDSSNPLIIQVGNCKSLGFGAYDRGSTAEKNLTNLIYSTSDVTYTGYVDFVFTAPFLIFDNPHLFVLLDGEDYEVVYKNAFVAAEVTFTNLAIVSYAKQ